MVVGWRAADDWRWGGGGGGGGQQVGWQGQVDGQPYPHFLAPVYKT